MTFGGRIQLLRKQNGMSQEELAEKLSVTRQTISKWELDQSTPELEFIARLSEIFGVSTDYLIKGTQDKAAAEPVSPPPAAVPENATGKIADGSASDRRQFYARLTLGVILTVIGLVGVLVFVILSTVYPSSAMNDFGYFEGLPGYLFCYDAWFYFILCCAVALAGIVICAFLSFYKKRQ